MTFRFHKSYIGILSGNIRSLYGDTVLGREKGLSIRGGGAAGIPLVFSHSTISHGILEVKISIQSTYYM
jgi:hypothetical protein